MDYLVEEVLARQPEGVQEFLLRSSVLARSSAPLCAAIMPNMDEGQAQDLLERLAKANLFYGGLGIFVGVIGYFVYRSMRLRSPASAPTSFLLLAAGLAIVLSIGALLLFRHAAREMIVMHIVYAAGFGWLVPILLRA